MTDLEFIMALAEAELGSELDFRHKSGHRLAAIAKRLEAMGWQPIETAPQDQLVMVYSPPTEEDWPDSNRVKFDHIDTDIGKDYWFDHGEHYEHYCCVGKPVGSIGPREKAPYTHWMPLPTSPDS
jgi:hypothetical protein